ncbi:MAG: hypothetical protein GY765_20705 [bacterium]|nr:hypothetical protein [bacterium]
MKRKTVVAILPILLLFVTFAVANEAPVEVWGSVLGANADVYRWSEFSCNRPDGTLDVEKYDNKIDAFARQGVTVTCEILFLINPEKIGQTNHLPVNFRDGKYDWESWNEGFFEKVELMAKICRKHGVTLCVCVYDRCHGTMPLSPWVLNHQGINTHYDNNAMFIRREYLRRLVPRLLPYGVRFTLENEPHDPLSVSVLYETLVALKSYSVKDEDILIGIEYFRKHDLFDQFKMECIRRGKWSEKYVITVHNVCQYWNRTVSEKNPVVWSDDGCMPWKLPAELWEEHLPIIFRNHPRKRLMIEHVARYEKDYKYAFQGIARAIWDYYGVWIIEKSTSGFTPGMSVFKKKISPGKPGKVGK